MIQDPNTSLQLNTRAFAMSTRAHGEVEVEVRGCTIYPEFVVLVDDEWVDADLVFNTDEWQEARERASEPADTCHHGN